MRGKPVLIVGAVSIISLFLFFFTPNSLARSNGTSTKGNFIEDFDKDGDGKVSADEFKGPENLFTKLDKNGDGFISESEAPKDPPKQEKASGGTPLDMDTDNDGKISKDEFKGPEDLFSNMDKNQDGFIDKSEIEQPKQHGQPSGSFIQDLDKDNDGKVSKDEFDGPEDFFSHMDKNGDGYISENEAPKGPQQQKME